MSFRRGDVVLVPFPFTEQKASKKRPALVVSSERYNDSCPDLIVAQITGRVDAPHRLGDHLVRAWREAGLLRPSMVRARLTTLNRGVILRHLGRMPGDDMGSVERGLRVALDLGGDGRGAKNG
jgi:mRNA interferase MazF